MGHKSIPCGITNCKNEAERWIYVGEDTLHICLDHLLALAKADDEPDELIILTPDKLNSTEVGVYSCSPKCTECNQ